MGPCWRFAQLDRGLGSPRMHLVGGPRVHCRTRPIGDLHALGAKGVGSSAPGSDMLATKCSVPSGLRQANLSGVSRKGPSSGRALVDNVRGQVRSRNLPREQGTLKAPAIRGAKSTVQ